MNKVRVLLFSSVIALAAAASGCVGAIPADAEEPHPQGAFESERVHPIAQVRIPVPHRWQVDDSADGVMSMSDPAGDVAIVFRVVDADDLLGAIAEASLGILTEVDDVELVGDPEEFDISGMPGVVADGRGEVDGNPVELSIAALETPSGKFLLMVGAADSARLARHASTITSIVRGIAPYAP